MNDVWCYKHREETRASRRHQQQRRYDDAIMTQHQPVMRHMAQQVLYVETRARLGRPMTSLARDSLQQSASHTLVTSLSDKQPVCGDHSTTSRALVDSV